ncbi:hypothetical protein BHM03_00014973 [Ensete ventricosum]|uniref:Uncharacterized protein n=1 Tax=Ensete ventricosum TaxID=4639 RepID=A0A445MEC1_ENSVE|nr:hypothetical protein BHM03_00014973 [Ensete ventricosum]
MLSLGRSDLTSSELPHRKRRRGERRWIVLCFGSVTAWGRCETEVGGGWGEKPKRSRRDALILRVKWKCDRWRRNNEGYPIVRYTLPHPSWAFGSSHVEGDKLLAGSTASHN